MRNNDERKAFITNEDNWQLISNLGNVRTFELSYKGLSFYRQEVLREDGKWRRNFWYRLSLTGVAHKLDLRQFVGNLEEIDRRKPDQGGKS